MAKEAVTLYAVSSYYIHFHTFILSQQFHSTSNTICMLHPLVAFNISQAPQHYFFF